MRNTARAAERVTDGVARAHFDATVASGNGEPDAIKTLKPRVQIGGVAFGLE